MSPLKIVGRGPVTPSASAGGSGGAKRTIRISLAQLRNLKNLKIKVGPLSCRKWHFYLERYFKRSLRDPMFNQHFLELEDIFRLQLDMGRFDKDARAGLALSFLFGFPGQVIKTARVKFALKVLRIPENKIIGAAQIFLHLKEASLKVRRAQANKRPYPEILERANEEIAVICSSKLHGQDFLVEIAP